MGAAFGVFLLAASLVPPSAAAPGVTPTTIKIGLHAPLTGASPLPSDSVDKAKDLYFRWMKSRGRSVYGRDVQVIVRNDGYNPTQAQDVCREMVEQDRVFMLIGISGENQMLTCAQYADRAGVPYVGPGIFPDATKGLDTYFATTMTPRAQGRLLGRYLVAKHAARARKNGAVSHDSPTFADPIPRFERALRRRGADLHYDRRVPIGAGTTEARLVVEEMKAQGIDNVFMNTTPVWFLQVVRQADTQEYRPLWTGIDSGIAKDVVAEVACGSGDSLHGARFFSAYPAIKDSDRFDPAFRKAVRKFYPGEKPDDFMWQLWALDKVLWKMLRRTGERPTRVRFVNRVERIDKLATGVGPTLRFTPRDHFGARSTHVLGADCSASRWKTVAAFKRGF